MHLQAHEMYPIVLRLNIKLVKLYKTGRNGGKRIFRDYSDKNDGIKLPPEPTTCCMSGCANCVWIAYVDELIKILNGNSEKAVEIVLNKIQDENLKAFLVQELRIRKHSLQNVKNSKGANERKDNKAKDK